MAHSKNIDEKEQWKKTKGKENRANFRARAAKLLVDGIKTKKIVHSESMAQDQVEEGRYWRMKDHDKLARWARGISA